MKALEKRISEEGEALSSNVLKVGSFLNQKIDTAFMFEMGQEIACLYKNEPITKIITIEASGIALALAAAYYMKVPVVFAKKSKTSNVSGEVYRAAIHSFTHNCDYNAVIPKAYLSSDDTVLIVDDFLADGNAVIGLASMIGQAGAALAGAAIGIEKGFQGGGDALRAKGVRVESLAIIEKMEPNKIVYR
ncbi:MAG: xanthine phosphoribosyltransferase [Clostridiales bacterium]|nr:xanthine phosphoribosyltransferase [Clostridiales bacterium]